MKRVLLATITLTAIGVAVKVCKRNEKNNTVTIGGVDSYPVWVREKLLNFKE